MTAATFVFGLVMLVTVIVNLAFLVLDILAVYRFGPQASMFNCGMAAQMTAMHTPVDES